MVLTAVIQEVNKEKVALIPQKGSCPGKALFKAKDSIFPFDDPNQINPQKGETVELEISPFKSILTSFMFFIFPLILLATTFIVAIKLTQREWIAYLAFAIAIIPTVLSVKLFSFITKSRFKPKLIRVLKDYKPNHCEGCSGCSLNG